MRSIHALALQRGSWGAPGHGGGGTLGVGGSSKSPRLLPRSLKVVNGGEREKNPDESMSVRCRAINFLKIRTYKATLKTISF